MAMAAQNQMKKRGGIEHTFGPDSAKRLGRGPGMTLQSTRNVALLRPARPMTRSANQGHDRVMAMASALVEKNCTPCRGGVPPLTPEAAEHYRQQAPEWALADTASRIERTYRFKNFRDAFAFVERAAALAEDEGHHPDISFGWGYATVLLRTKKIKGLHENDFIMATKLDRIAAQT